MTGVTLGACTVIPENAAPYHYRQNYYQSQDYSNDLIEPQENYQNYFREPNQVKKYRRMLKSDPQASDPYDDEIKTPDRYADTNNDNIDTLIIGKPYKVKGQRHVPRHQPDYNVVGMASWVGKEFQGKSTASGEPFNRYGFTAAHPTLPINALVQVTNLSNGHSVTVRINDRGPFVKGRIISLSEQAAKKLRFHTSGLTKVKVEYVGAAPVPKVAINTKL